MSFTKQADERIAICKKIVIVVQKLSDRSDEVWHVYTFKNDINNLDPCRFKVHNAKEYKLGIVPKEHLFDVFFNMEDSIVVLNIKRRLKLSSEKYSVEMNVRKVLPKSMEAWNVVVK